MLVQIELSVLVGAGRIKMSIIGQDVLVTRNEVLHLMSALEQNHGIDWQPILALMNIDAPLKMPLCLKF